MQQVTDFLSKHWLQILTVGTLLTAINRFSVAVIAPRYPRAASVIAALTQDYWIVLREAASLFGLPTEASQQADQIRAAKKAAKVALIMLCGFLVACTPAELQIANSIANLAKTLCLLDQAKARGTRADLVQDFCSTESQIAPYLPLAQKLQSVPRATFASCSTGDQK